MSLTRQKFYDTNIVNQHADIHIAVKRNDNLDIENINWSASEASSDEHEAKAMLLAFWDATNRQSLRIDLWTRDLTIHDMNDFFFQTFLLMADTYKKATNNPNLAADIKDFARAFAEKAVEVEQHKSS